MNKILATCPAHGDTETTPEKVTVYMHARGQERPWYEFTCQAVPESPHSVMKTAETRTADLLISCGVVYRIVNIELIPGEDTLPYMNIYDFNDRAYNFVNDFDNLTDEQIMQGLTQPRE